ncbi:MAG: hypothetical protein ACLFPX_06960 [Candidatus Omnitrophota bacterium]
MHAFRKAIRVVSVICCVLLVTTAAWAFLFSIPVMDREAISKLSDEKLLDQYIDVMIEIEAAQTFYSVAGLNPKEYEKLKKHLRFRTDLLLEMQEREIEIPQIK